MKQFLATGIDIVEVNRFKNFNKKSRLAFNTFTEKELSDCFSRANPSASLAARFAAKEAVCKAFGNLDISLTVKDVEVVKDLNQSVKVIIKKNIVNLDNYKISLSLTHEGSLAVAFCTILG